MNYRFLGLFFILFISISASAMKKKEIPKIPIKAKSVLNDALFEIVPDYKDFVFIPGQGSWQLWYETLNESYRGVIRYQDENRAWVKETLPVIAKGCLQDQYGIVTKLPYAPAWFALGVLEYEDGNYNLAEKHFLKASEIAQRLPQERAAHLHSAYGYALTAIKRGRCEFASSLLAHLFVTLTEHERPHWARTLRQEITKLKEHITTPWAATQLLLLSTSKKDRNMALEMWKSIPAQKELDEINNSSEELFRVLEIIKKLAHKNLSPQAHAVIAYVYSTQTENEEDPIDFGKPMTKQQALEKALQHIRDASDPCWKEDCEQALTMRGSIASRLGNFLEDDPSITKDEEMCNRIMELFKEAAQCGHQGAIVRWALLHLEDEQNKIPDEEAVKYIKQIQAVGESHLAAQSLLAQLNFAGNKFECGYTFAPDLYKAYHYTNRSECTLEMLVIKGLITAVGLERQSKKNINKNKSKAKSPWLLESNKKDATAILDLALQTNEERAYALLDEFFTSEFVPQKIKDFILTYIHHQCLPKEPSIFALRAYGIILLRTGNITEGIKLLERIGSEFRNPHGYIELSNAFRCGECVEQDLKKATSYCIRALNYFDEKTITYDNAKFTLACTKKLIGKFISPKYTGDTELKDLCIDLLTKKLDGLRINWVNEKLRKKPLDTSPSDQLG